MGIVSVLVRSRTRGVVRVGISRRAAAALAAPLCGRAFLVGLGDWANVPAVDRGARDVGAGEVRRVEREEDVRGSAARREGRDEIGCGAAGWDREEEEEAARVVIERRRDAMEEGELAFFWDEVACRVACPLVEDGGLF